MIGNDDLAIWRDRAREADMITEAVTKEATRGNMGVDMRKLYVQTFPLVLIYVAIGDNDELPTLDD